MRALQARGFLPECACSHVVLGEGVSQKSLEGVVGITPRLDTCLPSSPALPGPKAEEPSGEAELVLARLTLQGGVGHPRATTPGYCDTAVSAFHLPEGHKYRSQRLAGPRAPDGSLSKRRRGRTESRPPALSKLDLK